MPSRKRIRRLARRGEGDPMDGDKLLKLSTVAEKLDMNVRTVRKYVREGALPARRIGPNQLIRVKDSDVERFIKDKNKE
jgi:excisionase family DNA binding protein